MIIFLFALIVIFLIYLWFFSDNKTQNSNDGTSNGSNTITSKMFITLFAVIALFVIFGFAFSKDTAFVDAENKNGEVDEIVETSEKKSVSKVFDVGEHILTIYCGMLGNDEFTTVEDMESCSVQTPHFEGYEVVNVDVRTSTVSNKVYATYKNTIPVSCVQGNNGKYNIAGTPLRTPTAECRGIL